MRLNVLLVLRYTRKRGVGRKLWGLVRDEAFTFERIITLAFGAYNLANGHRLSPQFLIYGWAQG